MAYHGITINGVDTLETYGLILGADLEIPAPQLRESRVTIPGRDGTLNLSYALTGEPVYNDRVITGSLLKTESDIDMEQTRIELMTAYQGRTVDVYLPIDPDHFFRGVLQFAGVSGYNKGILKWSLEAEPWRLKDSDTVISKNLTTSEQTFTIPNEGRPVVPLITVTAETTIIFGGNSYTLATGDHRVSGIYLLAGNNTLKAKTTSGTGTMTLTFREGVL